MLCRGVDITVLSVRPKVAELIFNVYGKPLHPELFEVASTRLVERGDYKARLDITSSGHVVTWRCQGLVFTEVCASAHQVLPELRRLISYKLSGERHDQFTTKCGVAYRMSFQLEPVEPEVFWTFQHELSRDNSAQGLLHKFDSSGRVAMGAVSYIHAESRDNTLLLRAIHTFPDDYAVVKTQSIIEIPPRKHGKSAGDAKKPGDFK